MNEIVDELVEYCTKDYHSGALLLTGGWGCGKTYFIEHVLREELEENYILIRISLFGIDSVNTLNSLIKNKWIYRYLQEYNIIHEADEEFISKAKRFDKSFQRLITKSYKWINLNILMK